MEEKNLAQPEKPFQDIQEVIVLPKKQPYLKMVIIFLTVILLIAGGVCVGMQIGKKQAVRNEADRRVTPTPILTPTTIPVVDETVTWETYRNTKYGFEFKYPKYVEKIVMERNNILVKNLSRINAEYMKGCQEIDPGVFPCNMFAQDPNVAQNQIDLLTKVSERKDCFLLPEEEREIMENKDEYFLFTGPSSLYDVRAVKLGPVCGLRTVIRNALEVGIYNIRYKTFIKKEENMLVVDFPLFPCGVFDEVDKLYGDLGFSEPCHCETPICGDRLSKFKLDLSTDETAKSVIKVFDQILSTFKFIDSDSVVKPVEPDGKRIGFIEKAYYQTGQRYIDIDYVEWLDGIEGETACIEDRQCPEEDCVQTHCLPNGYYIRNNNPKIRSLVLDKDITIEIADPFDSADRKRANIDVFQEYVSEKITQHGNESNLFWITLIDGEVTEIVEQYRP